MSEATANSVVWAEIPVTDLGRAQAFYGAVLRADLKEENGGPNPIVMLPNGGSSGASGHLYPGKPAASGAGNTVHLAVPDALDAAMDRVWANGGAVLSDAIALPMGAFFYAADPDGNSIGFFKLNA